MLLDASGFTSIKSLVSVMQLPKMLYECLDDSEKFGMKILQNGYHRLKYKLVSHLQNGQMEPPDPKYLEDILNLEEKKMNLRIKTTMFEDLKGDLERIHVSSKTRVSPQEVI